MKHLLCGLMLALLAIPSNAVHAQIDTTIGLTAPKSATKDIGKLAHHLCDGQATDRKKLEAIFMWVTHNIEYDVEAMQRGDMEKQEAKDVLKKKKAMGSGYCELIVALCKEVNIAAVYVQGYAKDWIFDNGDKFYLPRHAWNAVYVDGLWQLLDATWAAGEITQSSSKLKKELKKGAKELSAPTGKLHFEYEFKPEYFLQDPIKFRLKHLPADPIWQLADTSMPLEVFEAGEEAIKAFNEKYHTLTQNSLALDMAGKGDEHERLQRSAERIYKYNPRYNVIMAAKYQANAFDTVQAEASNESNHGNAQTLALVQQQLKTSDGYLADQKKAMSSEYSELKNKNRKKNQDAKSYTQRLHAANRKLISQCQSYQRNTENRQKAIVSKAEGIGKTTKGVHENNIDKIKEPKKQEDAGSQALTTIKDSLASRGQRIARLKNDIAQALSNIDHFKAVHQQNLDTLVSSLELADSALVQETIARINMHDNLDDEVRKWHTLVEDVKLVRVESQQKTFQQSYDTLIGKYDALRKLQAQQVEMYKKNVKDIEKYKRRNSEDAEVIGQYDAMVKGMYSYADDQIQMLEEQMAVAGNNKKFFTQLENLYNRQEKLVDFMESSETNRKTLEENYLKEKETFDKKENEKQKGELKKTGERAEKYLTEEKPDKKKKS